MSVQREIHRNIGIGPLAAVLLFDWKSKASELANRHRSMVKTNGSLGQEGEDSSDEGTVNQGSSPSSSILAYKLEEPPPRPAMDPLYYISNDLQLRRGEADLRDALISKKCSFFEHCSNGEGGGQPMFKNYVGNCRVFWRSFNNMKFA